MENQLICDVCNVVIDQNDGKSISPEVFKDLMSQGFGIDESNIQLVASSGMSRDEAIQSISQMYSSSTSDWLLCQKCDLEAKEVLRKEP